MFAHLAFPCDSISRFFIDKLDIIYYITTLHRCVGVKQKPPETLGGFCFVCTVNNNYDPSNWSLFLSIYQDHFTLTFVYFALLRLFRDPFLQPAYTHLFIRLFVPMFVDGEYLKQPPQRKTSILHHSYIFVFPMDTFRNRILSVEK